MNKRKQDRLSQQARQIQTLFRDFKKMLGKCRQLALQLRVQMPNEALYSNIERTTLMKVTLLDLPGLINLKNSIAKTTSELLEQQREFTYKKQRQEINNKTDSNRNQILQMKKEQVISPQPRVPIQRPSQSLDSMRSSRASDSMRQSKSIQIPIYKARVETAQGKMDRISKYIASLKKNIKINADAAGSKWRVRDYLLTQPTYLHARAQLQRYLMRQQEIDRVVAKAVRTKIEQFFAQTDRVTSDEHFYYVKVKKPNKSTQLIHNANASPPKSEQKIAAKTITADSTKPIVQAYPVQKLAEQDFQEMKLQIQRKNESYVDMFVKMNEVVDSGRQRLNEIREKRKQAFEQEEDIWDEL